MKLLHDFVKKFNTSLCLDESLIVKKKRKLFLLNTNLKCFSEGDFFHAGLVLGKVRGKVFFPSFPFLSMIAKNERANKIFVNDHSEWLFVCGRDLFRRGIVRVLGVPKKGSFTLVLNKHGECLGFGKVIATAGDHETRQEIAVKHILDVGDFLRRERTLRSAR